MSEVKNILFIMAYQLILDTLSHYGRRTERRRSSNIRHQNRPFRTRLFPISGTR